MGTLVNTLLNFTRIPVIGATGAALATMVGYSSIWIIRTLQLRKIVRLKVNWRVQIESSILLVVQAVLAMTDQFYWIQVIPTCILLIIQRNNVFKVVRVLWSKLFKH